MNRRQIHTIFFRYLAVALLLTSYTGAVLFDSLHVIFDHPHHDAHQHCSAEIEASPCHQKVYHNNDIQGCDHSTHLIPERHDCELCDALFAKYFETKKEVGKTSVFNIPDFIPFYKEIKTSSFFFPSISLRGPPQLLSLIHI